MIVAKTYDIAVAAAALVKVTYEPGKDKPLFNLRDVLNSNQKNRIIQAIDDKNKTKGNITNKLTK